MSPPTVASLAPGSPAARAGLAVGDELLAVNGAPPRDVIEYRLAVDEADVVLDLRRGDQRREVVVHKGAGEPLGVEVSSAVFDRVRTCDNHCQFCFIYQLPKGMRRSLYTKDDDYRLSFLYGNFTTLTRFTELDFERVVSERLSPLFVSIHATDPDVRASLLRNRRGATSLRWLAALLEAGIEVHGQVVVCPGVNDGEVLEATLTGILESYPALATAGVVPLGVSDFTTEAAMRPHSPDEAAAVLDLVERYQELFADVLGRRLVYAADEYYLVAGRPFPLASAYDGFPQHENGIGMAAAFAGSFAGDERLAQGVRPGFFAAVDGAPAAGYRAPRTRTASGVRGPGPLRAGSSAVLAAPVRRARRPVGVLTGRYGAAVLAPLVASLGRADVRVIPVENRFFGGNIGVAGLLVGEDLARALAEEPAGHRYLLPDACLSEGRFLDGRTLADLPRPVEVVASDGWSLRRALDARA